MPPNTAPNTASSALDVFLYGLAIFIPPVPVACKRTCCAADFWINVALWILGWIPGILHAWYIISKYPEPPNRPVPP